MSGTTNVKSKLLVETALKMFGACFKTVVVKWQGKGTAEKLAFTYKITAEDRYQYLLWTWKYQRQRNAFMLWTTSTINLNRLWHLIVYNSAQYVGSISSPFTAVSSGPDLFGELSFENIMYASNYAKLFCQWSGWSSQNDAAFTKCLVSHLLTAAYE